VEQVRPGFVLFPTGYRNRFGFPKPAVVERWQRVGAHPLNTAETGAIQFWIAAEQTALVPVLYREDNPRTWLFWSVEQ
jgi:competence protein ComEC